jgi:spore germination protein PD
MHFQVINRELTVGNIDITGVATASIVLIGDTESICMSSIFDTPPEALIVGPELSFASA